MVFKKMMVARNTQLNNQALRQMLAVKSVDEKTHVSSHSDEHADE